MGLGPWAWASRTILLITSGIIFGKDIRKCTEDLELFGSAFDSSFSNAVVRNLDGVEELQVKWVPLWEGFRRSAHWVQIDIIETQEKFR